MKVTEFDKQYTQLNTQQRHAVDTIEGPVMVIAGPGTGKTQLLSMRAANILRLTDVDPNNILCLTFTDAAAINMRDRLLKLAGANTSHIGVYTFHGFGSDIIRRFPEYFETSPLLHPVDELATYEILSDIFAKIPLSNTFSRKMGDEYLHLSSTQAAISWCKQAGLTPNDIALEADKLKEFVDFTEPLLKDVFLVTPSAKDLPKYHSLLQKLLTHNNDVSVRCAKELATALDQVEPTSRYAKPVTTWRNTWMIQDTSKHWVSADHRRVLTLRSLAHAYAAFEKQLSSKGLYTYDDMILRVVQALDQSEELRLRLQEQYQYIMVDEYQDTNGVQNKLLKLLADNPVNEGSPNLLAVGDDDQAIYRFQGANISVMRDFTSKWRNVEVVVLTDNYRSGKAILDIARQTIIHGTDRLEGSISNVTKELVAATSNLPSSVMRPKVLGEIEQYHYVAQEIKKLIDGGSAPSQIAILASKHSYLQALVPYLSDAAIPVSYERREHILEQPHISALVVFAKFINAASKAQWDTANALLPELLAAHYWGVPSHELIKISIAAHREQKLWLELLAEHTNPQLHAIGEALMSIISVSLAQPFEVTLDQMIGNQPIELGEGISWTIPFRAYYFDEKHILDAPAMYIKLLGQLATLRTKLKEYRPEQLLTIDDFVSFVEMYERSQLTLLDTSPHNTNLDAVQLMTAYKAKGLEWDTVFLLGCQNDIWGPKARSRTSSFSLPLHLQWIKPARDNEDDRLRLFYVAMTRAKQQLYLASYSQTASGKPTEPLLWLESGNEAVPHAQILENLATEQLIQAHESHWKSALIEPAGDLSAILAPTLARYYLSPTHLLAFLNVRRGGPKHFLFRHLLRFPELMNSSAMYGNAIHLTLQYMQNELKSGRTLPPIETIQAYFSDKMLHMPIEASEKEKLVQYGSKVLKDYLVKHSELFKMNNIPEYDFKREGVMVGEARLTGKIDLIEMLPNKQVAVVDYKTGTPLESWKTNVDYQKLKAHQYRQQLTFYKILLDKSTSYSKKYAASTGKIAYITPNEDGIFPLLEMDYTGEDVERLSLLIEITWKHIMNLDFPDTAHYSEDFKGVQAFEEDLLSGKI